VTAAVQIAWARILPTICGTPAAKGEERAQHDAAIAAQQDGEAAGLKRGSHGTGNVARDRRDPPRIQDPGFRFVGGLLVGAFAWPRTCDAFVGLALRIPCRWSPAPGSNDPALSGSRSVHTGSMPQTDAPGSGPSAGQAELSPQLVEDLVRAAVAAPSMHNAQPWRFACRPGTRVIEMRADPARMLLCADPGSRGMHIGCGAALFNLRLAAGVADCQPVVQLFPDPDEPLLLATVRLTGPYRADDAERELYAAIPNRHTNRGPFSGQLVPPGVLAELADAACREDAILHILDHNETVRLLHLAVDAEREQLADPAYRAELARWVGGQRDRDGIPDSALGPRSPAGPTPVRDFTVAGQEPVRYALFEATPQLAVLSTRLNSPADWLRAGQALEGVLLTAAARGVAAAPLNLPLEMADAWPGRDPRSGLGQPQIVLRLGYGLPVRPTPRRPVREVLDPPPPTGRSDSVVDTSSARAYTSWWQFRSDAWSRLEEASAGLANAALRGQPADGMVEAASELLDALAPIERYWAFPGQQGYRRARDLFASASYDRFARMVARINRALVTESYRTGSGWPVVNGDPEKAELEDVVVEQAVPVRPYFEVLVVETLTAAQEHALREEVRSWRRPDDEFVYELVVPDEVEQRMAAGQQVVSATFVTPYPPGFPVLVPGQVFSREILAFIRNLDTPEIHGYSPEAGYRVYTSKAVEMAAPTPTCTWPSG
jgi:nitroreductase